MQLELEHLSQGLRTTVTYVNHTKERRSPRPIRGILFGEEGTPSKLGTHPVKRFTFDFIKIVPVKRLDVRPGRA